MCDKVGPEKKTIQWVADPNAKPSDSGSSSSSDPSKSGGSSGKDVKKGNYPYVAEAPACPSSLEGTLVAQMINPDDLATITPLGNVSPPGHTFPIDHQYLDGSHEGKVALNAPADAWIARLQEELNSYDGGKTYQPEGFVYTLVVCQGFVLDLAVTGNAELAPNLRALLPADLSQTNSQCKLGLHKAGHENQNQGQCYFDGLNVKVKAGDLLGYMKSTKSPHGGFSLDFETWAANYNVEPPANGVHWDWYNDNRYIHSICLYDQFTPELKAKYQAKYGGMQGGKAFYRTTEPRCGTTSQDTPGTLLGYWFGQADGEKQWDASGAQYGDNAGISFIRYNVDPSKAEIVDGGGLVKGSAQTMFTPTHAGTVDRDPVEVTPGDTVYCYNALGGIYEQLGGKSIPGDHRYVVQLVDATHVKVDLQTGKCTGKDALSATAVQYVR
jgi:hypothetical protein